MKPKIDDDRVAGSFKSVLSKVSSSEDAAHHEILATEGGWHRQFKHGRRLD